MACRSALSNLSFNSFRLISRKYSSSPSLLDINVNSASGVALVTMQRLPVNSLNLDLIAELSSAIENLEKAKARGLILTSASKSVFSAGLDITEMYKPDMERVTKFWTNLQDFWLKLYGSSIPTVAAINGHSPAGGCLVAMSCEYRVMVKDFTIGLNETKLGIIAPFWFISTMKNTISNRQSEVALTTGRMFTTEEASNVGLIDEVASDKADAIAKAEKFLQGFSKIPPLARAATKMVVRGAALKELVENRKQDLDTFLQYITQPKVQQGLGLYLESLKVKK